MIIVIPIYLLVAVTALGSVKPVGMTAWDYLASQKETALVNVARQFFTGGGMMILVGGLISTMSALNATIYSSSRVAFAMGRDRNFPAFFSRVHPVNFTPHWGILVSLVIVVLMAVSLPIEDVASAADIMFLLLFLQVNLAMIRLRKKRPDLDRGFRVPLFPWLSILGIAMLLFLAIYMLNYSLIAWVVTAGWIVAGLFIYTGYASRREIEHLQKVQALERIERKEYSILVCLSNPQSVGSLTATAIAIAKRHNGEIIFLHVIEVREGQPLRAGLEETSRVRPLLQEAESLTREAGIPARSIIQVSHRISQGIVETALMEKCNFIVIRRPKQITFMGRVFSSIVDTVLQKATSEVAVLHGEFGQKKIRKILIPFGTSIHTRLATEIAPALGAYFGAELSVVVVFDPDTPVYGRDKRLSEIRQVMEQSSVWSDLKVVTEKDVLKGVLKEAADADLVLMGGRTGDFLELLLSKSLSEEITEQVKCPVLWVREYEEPRSLWAALLKPAERGKG